MKNCKLGYKFFDNKIEFYIFILIYILLFFNAYIMKDSIIALVSAFCGITYTLFAGKGNPLCYIIGIFGSFLYVYLSYSQQLWGNLLLYALYFIPMQIVGFVNWNKNLKSDKYTVIKQSISKKDFYISFLITFVALIFVIYILYVLRDQNPVIDGITTTFSILGMYYTVRRAIQQWFIWGGVNILSFIMWLTIAVNNSKTYSTAFMWFIYSFLSVYFYYTWKKELEYAST